MACGALAAAKLGWDRLTGEDDPRRFALREDEPVREGVERIAVGQLDNSIEGLAGRERRGLGDRHPRGAQEHQAPALAGAAHAPPARRARLQARQHRVPRHRPAPVQRARQPRHARHARRRERAPPAQGARQGLAPFRRTLLSRHANAQRKLRDSDAASEALRELRQARDRVAHWPVDGESVASLAPGSSGSTGAGGRPTRSRARTRARRTSTSSASAPRTSGTRGRSSRPPRRRR